MMTTCQVGEWSTTDCVHRTYAHLFELDIKLDIRKMKGYYNRQEDKDKRNVIEESRKENKENQAEEIAVKKTMRI